MFMLFIFANFELFWKTEQFYWVLDFTLCLAFYLAYVKQSNMIIHVWVNLC